MGLDRWLARFSMSFIIIAVVLAYTSFQTLQQHGPMWRIAVYLFAAAASIALGATGTRIRHRKDLYGREDRVRRGDRQGEDDR